MPSDIVSIYIKELYVKLMCCWLTPHPKKQELSILIIQMTKVTRVTVCQIVTRVIGCHFMEPVDPNHDSSSSLSRR